MLANKQKQTIISTTQPTVTNWTIVTNGTATNHKTTIKNLTTSVPTKQRSKACCRDQPTTTTKQIWSEPCVPDYPLLLHYCTTTTTKNQTTTNQTTTNQTTTNQTTTNQTTANQTTTNPTTTNQTTIINLLGNNYQPDNYWCTNQTTTNNQTTAEEPQHQWKRTKYLAITNRSGTGQQTETDYHYNTTTR